MKIYKYWFLLPVIFLAACAEISFSEQFIPVKFETVLDLNINYQVQKCLYSSTKNTVFSWQKDTNLIHIYKHGKQINTIGGLGFEQNNFNKLSDICLAPDGSLLTLDSFSKQIKKFDSEGKFITAFEFEDLIEPTLFDISLDETFYVYDRSRNEIVVRNAYTAEEFQFGDFQLKTPTDLTLKLDKILVYDHEHDSTVAFNSFGQFLWETKGYIQMQKDQKFALEKFYIKHLSTENQFCLNIRPWQYFLQKDNYSLLASDQQILIGKIQYEIQ